MSTNENTTISPWASIEDEVTQELRNITAMADLLSASSREGPPEVADRTIPTAAEAIYWGATRVERLLDKLRPATERPEG